MEHAIGFLLTPHPALLPVALGASALAVLLHLLARARQSGQRARVVGPGPRGAVVYRERDAGDPRAPAFVIALVPSGEERVVLPRGATLITPRLGPARGALRVGDPVRVDGLGVTAPREESLYREVACRPALDALLLVRLAPRRTAVLRAASALSLCIALLAMGGAVLPGAIEQASQRGALPDAILEAGRLLTRAGIACPDGARVVSEQRATELPGFVHRCRRAGRDHGPFVERDATGFLRRAGAFRDGQRDGRWLTQLPLDDETLLLREESFREGVRDGPHRALTRDGAEETGRYCAGRKCGWWERRHCGEPVEAGTYLAGVKDGYWLEEHGRGSYRRGQRQGEWILREGLLAAPISLLGAATIFCRMVDGRKQGPATIRFADGRFAAGRFRDDRPDGRWTVWSARGKKQVTVELRSGTPLGLIRAGQNPALAIGQRSPP